VLGVVGGGRRGGKPWCSDSSTATARPWYCVAALSAAAAAALCSCRSWRRGPGTAGVPPASRLAIFHQLLGLLAHILGLLAGHIRAEGDVLLLALEELDGLLAALYWTPAIWARSGPPAPQLKLGGLLAIRAAWPRRTTALLKSSMSKARRFLGLDQVGVGLVGHGLGLGPLGGELALERLAAWSFWSRMPLRRRLPCSHRRASWRVLGVAAWRFSARSA